MRCCAAATAPALAFCGSDFGKDGGGGIEREADHAADADGEGGINPPRGESAHACRPVLREVVQRGDVFHPEVPADDKHRCRTRHRQRFQQFRREPQQRPPRRLQQPGRFSAPVEAEVVDFDYQRDHAIDGGGEYQRDGGEAEDLCQQRFADEARQGDDDDFQREDEVGADGGADFFLFNQRRVARVFVCDRVGVIVMQQARIFSTPS